MGDGIITARQHQALMVIRGAGAPTAGGGVAAGVGWLYVDSSSGDLWQKTGSGNTDWTQRNLTGPLIYKGAIDCSGNPNYPAANAGYTYIVSVAGKIGGASGIVVEVGDLAICNTDGTGSGDQATVGAYWNIAQSNVLWETTGGNLAMDGTASVGNTGKVVHSNHVHPTDTGRQAASAELSGIAALATTGMVARTTTGTYTVRTLAGTANRISVANGDGVSAAPTINIDTSLFPSPGAGDAGKALIASGANTAAWGTVSAADANAIHGNASGEINAITGKTAIVDTDVLLIEDSGATFAKKSVTRGALMAAAINVTDATDSSNTTSGSIKTAGGLGVVKNVYIGGNLVVTGTATVTGTVSFLTTDLKQTVLTGLVSSGQAAFMAAGASCTVVMTATAPVPVVMTWSRGYTDSNLIATVTSNQTFQSADLPKLANPFLYVEHDGTSTLTYKSTVYPRHRGPVCIGTDCAAVAWTMANNDTDLTGNTWTKVTAAYSTTVGNKWGAGYALKLNGTTEYAWLQAPVFPNLTKWGFGFFFYASSLSATNQYIFSAPTFSMAINVPTSDKKLRLYLGNNGSSYNIHNGATAGGAVLSTATWYYVYLSYDGQTYRLYLDGSLASGVSVASTSAIIQPDQFRIGAATAACTGYYCDFTFVPQAVNYSATFTVPAAAPTAPELHWYDANTQKKFKGYPGAWTQTNRLFVGECVTGIPADTTAEGLYSTPPTMTISGADTKRVSASVGFDYSLNGLLYYEPVASITNISVNPTTIPQNKYGCFAWQVNSAGSVSAIGAANNATGYNTAADALAACPASTAGSSVVFGCIVVINTSAGGFVGGTTTLDAAGVTVRYYNSPGYTQFTQTAWTVTSVTTYAIRGEAQFRDSVVPNNGAATETVWNDNIGTQSKVGTVELVNTTFDTVFKNGEATGQFSEESAAGGDVSGGDLHVISRNSVAHTNGIYGTYLLNKTTGATFTIQAASWKYKVNVRRV